MPGKRIKTLVTATALAIACSGMAVSQATAGGDPHAGRWATVAAVPGLAIAPLGPCPTPGPKLNPTRSLQFIYRIQRPWDVELLGHMLRANPNSVPVRSQDIFMVQARDLASTWSTELVWRLIEPSILSGQIFRCNRVAALTGVRTDNAVPYESAYRLIDDPRVWAIVPDWEKPFWRTAYPNGPYFSRSFGPTLRRAQTRIRHIHAAGKSAGFAITGWRNRGPRAWPYGELAKRSNQDIQAIQVQEECLKSPGRFGWRARELANQYRSVGEPVSHLALEISLSANPGSTSLHNDVTPKEAARCAVAGWKAGVKSFYLWGNPRVLPAFFSALPDRFRG